MTRVCWFMVIVTALLALGYPGWPTAVTQIDSLLIIATEDVIVIWEIKSDLQLNVLASHRFQFHVLTGVAVNGFILYVASMNELWSIELSTLMG